MEEGEDGTRGCRIMEESDAGLKESGGRSQEEEKKHHNDYG